MNALEKEYAEKFKYDCWISVQHESLTMPTCEDPYIVDWEEFDHITEVIVGKGGLWIDWLTKSRNLAKDYESPVKIVIGYQHTKTIEHLEIIVHAGFVTIAHLSQIAELARHADANDADLIKHIKSLTQTIEF